MAEPLQVRAIEAVVGGGFTVVLARSAAERAAYSSTSPVILAVLIGAFTTAAKVEVETVGQSMVIQRVPAFEAGDASPVPYPGDYIVSRVATQREATGTDRLEVFLSKPGDGNEVQYNAYDPLVQQVLMAAFTKGSHPTGRVPLYVQYDDDKVIVVARIGEPAA